MRFVSAKTILSSYREGNIINILISKSIALAKNY